MTKAIHTTDRDNLSVHPASDLTTTTYAQPCDGTEGPYDYQRGGNPHPGAALETTLSNPRGAKHAFAYPPEWAPPRRPRHPREGGRPLGYWACPSYGGGTYRFATIELPAAASRPASVGDFTALTDEDYRLRVTMVFLESPSRLLCA